MYRVRYYTKQYHPDHFRKGFLGWCIRSLNHVRWKLEVFVQYLVLRYFIGDDTPDDEVSRIIKNFKRDVEGEKLEKVITSPEVGGSSTSQVNKGIPLPPDDGVPASSDEPFISSIRDGETTDEAFSRYMNHGRSSRYARSRGFGDPDGDFEPVEKKTSD